MVVLLIGNTKVNSREELDGVIEEVRGPSDLASKSGNCRSKQNGG